MNIVLVGMRGSGKTTVGKILAAGLKRQFVDMDELIAQKVGLSIPEIVDRYGWGKFRQVESEVAREAAGMDRVVIAAGGGLVTGEQNVSNLKSNGVIIWLTADIDSLVRRTAEETGRPSLLAGKSAAEEMNLILNEREPLYRKAADLVVDTGGKDPVNVAGAIIRLLEANNRQNSVSGQTRVCCIIGNPVEHSLSPLIHNSGFLALGLDYVYIPFQAGNIQQAVEGIRGMGIRGASITMPFKISVMKYLDEIDPAARKAGAVNTVVNENGRLIGFNTDGSAAVKLLEESCSLKDKKVVLVGGGGVAASIAAEVIKKNARLEILNRTVEKAAALAKSVSAGGYGGLEKLGSAAAGADILINATSVGMGLGSVGSIVPAEFLHEGLIVLDTVYYPKETKLLKEAAKKGCTVIYGYKMLLYQAVAQFELFTGRSAPVPVMNEALLGALGG